MAEVKIPTHIDEIDVSDFERWIGVTLPQPEQYNYDVTRDTIRHFAYGINDYNGVYLEPDYATSTRFKGIIAPPGYLYSHGGNPTWVRLLGNIPGITQNDNSGEIWEFLIPIRPGDSIVANVKAHSVEKRQGRRAGPLVIVRSERIFTNQRGEIVARNMGASFRFSTRGVVERGGMAQNVISASGGKLRELPPTPDWPAPGTVRWLNDNNVYWDNVVVGEEIPAYELGILHNDHFDRFSAGMSGRFTAARLDPDVAAARGTDNPIPTRFAPGIMRTAWIGTLLTKWGGPNIWVSNITYQNREWNLAGYGVTCKGRITGKRIEQGRHLVDLDVWVENDLGMVTNPGSAIVELAPNQIQSESSTAITSSEHWW
jgi:acyl dehydratase